VLAAIAAAVAPGSATGGPTPAPMRALRIDGPAAGAHLGASVAGAGDVNGDGSDDVIVSVHLYDNGQLNEGAAWIAHGDPRPPFEPDDLRVIDGDDDVTLSWAAPGVNIDGYIVHRYGTDGQYDFFLLDGNATSFIDPNPPSSGVAFYWVQAVNDRSQIGPFVQCGVAPGTKGWATGALGPLPNPWFTVSVSGDDVTLHWEKSPVGTVTGYNIWSTTSEVPLGTTGTLSNVASVSGLTTTKHTLTNLSPGTHYFRITAVVGTTTESNLASARQVAVVVN
jgi:hypothetical protein